MNKETSSRAFTLIELLVVIAIIGILSSVVLASLSNARANARDTARIQKINQIRTALEMYANDNNGNYPNRSFAGSEIGYTEPDSSLGSSWKGLESDLSPYINSLPRAEIDSPMYRYAYKREKGMYGLGVYLESPTTGSKNDGGVNDTHGNHYYSVGTIPSYCAKKYSGGDARWWSWNNQTCKGGD